MFKFKIPLKSMRRLYRAMLSRVLPKSIVYYLMRKQVVLPDLKNLPYKFKLVETTDEMNRALCLLHDAYVDSGYMKPSDHEMRITPYHMSPTTLTLIAKDQDKVIATTSIILKGSLGLPIESVARTDEVVGVSSRVVEVSSLAIDREYSGQYGRLLFPMMKLIYHCAADLLGANYEVIGVNPKMVPMYEGLFLFQPITKDRNPKAYSFVNEAPVVPMYYCLDSREASYAKAYGKVKTSSNFLRFFEQELPPQFDLPISLDDYCPPIIDESYFRYLFCECTNFFENLPIKIRMEIEQSLGFISNIDKKSSECHEVSR